MITIKEAFESARNFLAQVYPGATDLAISLEEADLSDDERYWYVTLGFNRQIGAGGAGDGLRPERAGRVFKVDARHNRVIPFHSRDRLSQVPRRPAPPAEPLITLREAYEAACRFLAELYPEETDLAIALEEADLSADERYWYVTLGFSRARTPALGDLRPTRSSRVFKVDARRNRVIPFHSRNRAAQPA